MPVVAYEAVVENSQVHLPSEVVLPEKATVYVVVPEVIVEMEKRRWWFTCEAPD